MILLRTFLVVWAVGLAAAGTEALAQQLAPAPEAPTGRTAKSLGIAISPAMLARLCAGDHAIPAGRIRADRTEVFADAAAARDL